LAIDVDQEREKAREKARENAIKAFPKENTR